MPVFFKRFHISQGLVIMLASVYDSTNKMIQRGQSPLMISKESRSSFMRFPESSKNQILIQNKMTFSEAMMKRHDEDLSSTWKHQILISEDQISYGTELANSYCEMYQVTNKASVFSVRSGFIGEVCFCDIIKVDRPTIRDCHDNGVDVFLSKKLIDVKTMRRNFKAGFSWVNNLNEECFKKWNPDLYVFCSVFPKRKIFEICGWLFRHEIKEKWLIQAGTVVPHGSGTKKLPKTCFNIPNNEIRRFNLQTFCEDIKDGKLL